MLGKSIYLNINSKIYKDCIKKISHDDYCFVSLHMPEDNHVSYYDQCNSFLNEIYACTNKIIADVSKDTLKFLGINVICDLAKDKRIFALRFDDGFTKEEIVSVAPYCKICINASVLDAKLVSFLEKCNVEFFAMHNFYPREETALDCDICLEINEFCHQKNIKVGAFISSDICFRGPVYRGLPSVEEYRFYPPYIQYLLLKKILKVDIVFVGDPAISLYNENLILNYEKNSIVSIPCEFYNNSERLLKNKIFTIRQDSNSISARLLESRQYASHNNTKIGPFNNIERKKGCITIDNDLYNRYCGEIIIVKKNLKACEKVNVIAKIKKDFLPILEIINPNDKVCLI